LSCEKYPIETPEPSFTFPVKSVSFPEIILSKVDLPAPFRPATTNLSPFSITKSKSFIT
jgi:hypothetical protein